MCNQSEAARLRRRHSDPADEPGTRLLHLLSEAAVADLHELKIENLLLHPFFSSPCPGAIQRTSLKCTSEVLVHNFLCQLFLSNLLKAACDSARGVRPSKIIKGRYSLSEF
jgi:hypothetical protein